MKTEKDISSYNNFKDFIADHFTCYKSNYIPCYEYKRGSLERVVIGYKNPSLYKLCEKAISEGKEGFYIRTEGPYNNIYVESEPTTRYKLTLNLTEEQYNELMNLD